MAKWVCNVCGYVYEGDAAPETCPVCKAPASKFTKQDAEMTCSAAHVISASCFVNLEAGALHTGQVSGAASPS